MSNGFNSKNQTPSHKASENEMNDYGIDLFDNIKISSVHDKKSLRTLKKFYKSIIYEMDFWAEKIIKSSNRLKRDRELQNKIFEVIIVGLVKNKCELKRVLEGYERVDMNFLDKEMKRFELKQKEIREIYNSPQNFLKLKNFEYVNFDYIYGEIISDHNTNKERYPELFDKDDD
jgi:predicted phosphohydrolase